MRKLWIHIIAFIRQRRICLWHRSPAATREYRFRLARGEVAIKGLLLIFIIGFVVVFNYAVARLLASQPVRKFSNGVKVICLFLFLFVVFLTGQGGCLSSIDENTSGSSTPVQAALSITTNPATNVTQTTATLNGAVNPNGVATNVYFEYGRTTTYGLYTSYQYIGAGTTNINVSAPLTGLSINTNYNFRIKAVKGGTIYSGPNQNFTTPGLTPICTTYAADNITSNSARLNGTVNANTIATTGYFNYGLTTSYGSTTLSQPIGSGTSNFPVTIDISGLSVNTLYNFRVVGTNSSGTTYGNNLTFTTTN